MWHLLFHHVSMHVVETTESTPCKEVNVHNIKDVKVGSGATAVAVCRKLEEAAASDIQKKADSKVNDGGQDTALSRLNPPVDAKLKSIVGTSPATTSAELRNILNIAYAGVAVANLNSLI